MSHSPARLMLEETSTPGSTAEETQARSRLYRLLGRAFAFPEGSLYQELAGGAWKREVAEAVEALPFSLDLADLNLAPSQTTNEALQAEYVRLFEVGLLGGPPCSLFAGHHERDRQRTMEELVRFYDFFDLHLTSGERPDHLTVELEFMHFLAFREAESLREGGDRASYLRAQRDFLERHLGRFLAALAEKVRAQDPPPFYEALAELGRRFTRQDYDHIAAALAGL